MAVFPTRPRRAPGWDQGCTTDRFDALLDRAYDALGSRMLLAYVAFGWICGGALELFAALAIARIERLTTSQCFELIGLTEAANLVGVAAGLAGSRRLMAPLNETSGLQVVRKAFRLPFQISLWNCAVALLWCCPTTIIALAVVGQPDSSVLLYMVLFAVPAVSLLGSAGVFGAQLVMRPILRDLASVAAPEATRIAAASVRLKLVVLVPAITVTMGGWTALFATAPGPHHDRLVVSLVISVAASAIVAVPITLLLAHSLLRPLDDLVHAADRLRDGEFATPVPILSADEFGTLAQSFNAAMSGLAERQQLAAHNEQLLADVRASRARLVAASDAERRRVERNIHDGAQQRLVALTMDLRLIADMAAGMASDELRVVADEASHNLRGALDELRDLARGLHPAVLETDGLGAALKQLASRSSVPVVLTGTTERLATATVESTAYFVAAEAVTNVSKHAHASHAEITLCARDGRLLISIRDDGVGGARMGAGSGLDGLADRVAALDGTLSVTSPPGLGTTITADLPLAPSA